MVSGLDKWGKTFPSSQASLDYDEPDSIKAVILIADGAFNSAKFGDQGNSDQHARALCDTMKA